MNATEKQESQKTVVAFVAGLLIGGLLVWVFSSPDDGGDVDRMQDDESAEVDDVMNDDVRDTTSRGNNGTMTETETAPAETVAAPADANITVSDQMAGNVVVLDQVTFPAANGWVVVREYDNDVAGNTLGAARFDTQTGLIPQSVTLLRATEAGHDYQVVFYIENGDDEFSLTSDSEVTGVVGMFSAS